MINFRAAASTAALAALLCFSGGTPGIRAASTMAHGDADLTKPAQGTVALKGAFASIDGHANELKSALSAQDLKTAATLEGKQGSFTGKVAKIYIPDSNSIVVLDFAVDYETAITAVVKPESYKLFPDLKSLDGKTVLITGPVTVYKGRPQVVLSALNQIKIVNR